MSSSSGIPIFPSRGSQTLMNSGLKGAPTGHSLLKKKADALQMRFRIILGEIIETKTLMGKVMKEAAFSLAEAKLANRDFNQQIIQNVNTAKIKVSTKKDNVAGVSLPIFKSYQELDDSGELTGLAREQQLAKLKKNYQKAIGVLVDLASLQTSFVTLDEAIKNIYPDFEDSPSTTFLSDIIPGRGTNSFISSRSIVTTSFVGISSVGQQLRSIGDDFDRARLSRSRSGSLTMFQVFLQGRRRSSAP